MFRLLQEGLKEQGITPNALTIKEVSVLLHVHEQTIRRWANQGLIKTYRVGPRGDRRFSANDVAIFLQKSTGNKFQSLNASE
jgi:excisionase family DNA binding protein